jgi:uncharacterized protein (TIGR02599 family)
MKSSTKAAGFTLVEVIVAAGIVVVLMGVLISMTDQTQRMMRATSAKVEQFQEARVAFESMTRRLAQATLNTYWDYRYDARGLPKSYQRSAELRFISGVTSTLVKGGGNVRPGTSVFFHAPNGFVEDQNTFGPLDHLINAWGYFVEIGTDEETIPPFLRTQIDSRKRYRLMELMQPSEKLKTYEFQKAGATDWFAPLVTANPRPVRALAENIVALIVLPRLSRADEQLYMTQKGTKTLPILAPLFSYDSTNSNITDPILNPHSQLPPVVQVVMVAIDEPSAKVLEDKYGDDPNLGINYSTTFRNPATLEDNPSTPTPNDGDLSKLETILINKRVSYRIFSTNVSIRGAKWSRTQAN